MKKQLEAPPDRLLNRRQLREFIRAGDWTISRWIKAGEFPAPVMVGCRCYWKWSELKAWMDAKEGRVKP